MIESISRELAQEICSVLVVRFERGRSYANSVDHTLAILIEQRLKAELPRVIAAEQTAKLVKRLKDGRDKSARHVGVKPYGVDLMELSTIAQMKRLRAGGDSWASIARALTVAGVPTRSGKTWHGSTVAKIVERAR